MNRILIVICFSALTLLFIARPNAFSLNSKHYVMFSAGDSITAGFISTSSAVNSVNPNPTHPDDDNDEGESEMISVNHNLFFQSTDSQPFSFRLWFAQLFDHKKTYSWASGESISSHYLKLRDFFAKTDPTITLEARNVAYAGAMSSDLARQATVLVSIWKNEKFNVVPYITLLIGANDVCLDTQYGTVSDAQVSAHILGFFKILSTIHQDWSCPVKTGPSSRLDFAILFHA